MSLSYFNTIIISLTKQYTADQTDRIQETNTVPFCRYAT